MQYIKGCFITVFAKFWLFFLICTAFCAAGYAEQSGAMNMNIMTQPSTSWKLSEKLLSLTATGEFQYISFVRANKAFFGEEKNSASLTAAGVSVQTNENIKKISSLLDVHWFYVPEEDFHYFNLRELSREIHKDENTYWLGRHVHEWSEADSYWSLGIWQPQFLWDYYNPQEQGLTGIFSQTTLTSNTKLNFFVSGIYLPDQAAQYRQENGQINF